MTPGLCTSWKETGKLVNQQQTCIERLHGGSSTFASKHVELLTERKGSVIGCYRNCPTKFVRYC